MLLTRPQLLDPESAAATTDWPRIRFSATLTLYGAAIGAAAIIVNFLSQTPSSFEPQHMPFTLSFMFGAYGAMAGGLITGPIVYWIYGGIGFFYARKRRPRGILIWSFLGFGYGIVFLLIMGGFFLPVGALLTDFYDGLVSVPGLLSQAVDIVTARWAPLALVLGFRLFFTGLLAGGVFAVGAWVIDRFNASEDSATATYGPWAVALAQSVSVIAISIFGPVDVLAKLG
jgi:hypothetical protein